MLTPKMSGIFDCRKYDQSGKKAHDQREMLADTDNVTFCVLQPIGQVSECFMNNGQLDEFARPRVSKREREAAAAENRQEVTDVVSIKFKVGSNCKWFDRYARPMDRPTNEELEKNRWMAQLDFTKQEKDPSKPLSPSGYWVNAIMVCPVEQNPFTGQAFEQAAEVEEPEKEEDPNGDGLPFD